jgi:hypothetical protein
VVSARQDKRAWFKELMATCLEACTEAWDGVGERPETLPDGMMGGGGGQGKATVLD